MKVVDEEMDGVAREQRKRLQTIDSELTDVRRRLDRLYNLVETTDLDMADVTPRIRDHRERQQRLEISAEEARAILSQRREVLDDVKTITAYAQDMSEFLNESELTERRAFIESFVKEIVVMPGNALMRYTLRYSAVATIWWCSRSREWERRLRPSTSLRSSWTPLPRGSRSSDLTWHSSAPTWST